MAAVGARGPLRRSNGAGGDLALIRASRRVPVSEETRMQTLRGAEWKIEKNQQRNLRRVESARRPLALSSGG